VKKIYVDSSIIVSLLLKEKGYHSYRKILENADLALSSSLIEAEVYSVAAREKIPLQKAEEFIQLVSLVIPERSLQKEYFSIFEKNFSRGADTFHLATALYLDPSASELTFMTADKNQGRIAAKLGFQLATPK
jgi:predicted nucleic acid-binding protein